MFGSASRIAAREMFNKISYSGVTTMGSDRANPGAPNPNGPNGGPQAQAVKPGPLICHNVVF